MAKIALVLGYGPQVGHGVALAFGNKGYKVVLVARNKAKLAAAVEEFANKGIAAYAFTADFTKTSSTISMLKKVIAKVGVPDVFVYNAKPWQGLPSALKISTKQLNAFLQATISTLVESVKLIADAQKRNGGGSILLTGGGLGLNGAWASGYDAHILAATNAFWHNLAESLHVTLKTDKIHVGTVIITAFVKEGDAKHSPELIGKQFYELHAQAPDTWTDKIVY